MNDDLESTGNVFADLGLAEPEEALAKAELARRITALIRARGLTQTTAAELLGVDQPKVSALAHGRLGGFSLERLVRFLIALDQDVEIVVRPAPRSHGARVSVAAVGGAHA
jgi:predicted XRE-type DNA-binding protein